MIHIIDLHPRRQTMSPRTIRPHTAPKARKTPARIFNDIGTWYVSMGLLFIVAVGLPRSIGVKEVKDRLRQKNRLWDETSTQKSTEHGQQRLRQCKWQVARIRTLDGPLTLEHKALPRPRTATVRGNATSP